MSVVMASVWMSILTTRSGYSAVNVVMSEKGSKRAQLREKLGNGIKNYRVTYQVVL